MASSATFGFVLFVAVILLLGSYVMLFMGISQPSYVVGKVDPVILNWSGAVVNVIAVILIAVAAAGVARTKGLY